MVEKKPSNLLPHLSKWLKLKRQRILPAEADNGQPCRICHHNSRVDALERHNTKLWQKRNEAINNMRQPHPVCSGCGLLIGGLHLATPHKIDESLYCQFCHKELTGQKLAPSLPWD